MEVVSSVTGKAIELGKVTGPEEFLQAAKEAARQWEFSPAHLNAEPVRVRIALPFLFSLE